MDVSYAESQRVLLVGSIQDLDGVSQEIKDGLIVSIKYYGDIVRKEERRRIINGIDQFFNR